MTTKESIESLCDELKAMLVGKNAAYGDSASKPPVLCPHMNVNTAILVRMSDKINRITNLLEYNYDVEEESIEDTMLDLAGYALLYVANRRKAKDND